MRLKLKRHFSDWIRFFFRNNVRVTLNGPVDVTGGSRDGPSTNDVASITISGRMKRRIGGEK